MARLSSLGLVVVCCLLGQWIFVVAIAVAQSMPPQASPGAVMNSNLRQWELQKTQPWLSRPIGPEDVQPSDKAPVIELQDLKYENGRIVPATPPPQTLP